MQISARRGLLIIRRGKGLKHREIPLIQEAREPLDTYFTHRQQVAERWRERARVQGEPVAFWSRWPDGHLFLGQRGPLTERGIREIIAKLGQAAKLPSPLGPHDLRHTFAKSLLDLAAYGLDRQAMPLPAIHFGALLIDGVQVELMGDMQKRLAHGAWEDPVDLQRHTRIVDYEGMRILVLSLEYECQAYLKLGRTERACMLREFTDVRSSAQSRLRCVGKRRPFPDHERDVCR